MEVADVRHVVRLEDPAVDDEYLIAGGDEFLDGSAADEPRAAEEDDFQALSFTVSAAAFALPLASPAFPRTE
jgi:hypothetical protein